MSQHSEQKREHSKADAIEYEKRVETVRQLIISGADMRALVPDITARWNIKPRMFRRYLFEARKRNQAYAEVQTTEMYAEHIAHRRDLRRRAKEKGNLKAELAAAQDEAKLIGLYESDRQSKEYLEWLKANGLTESEAVTQFRTLLGADKVGSQSADEPTASLPPADRAGE